VTSPLQGLRVVEFGNLVAAPYCGMLLADLGAEVIKVEPTTGDLAREIPPFYGEASAFFIAVNRGKRSAALDPKADGMEEVLRKLALSADVIVNNLRWGAMDRMGLGYAGLADSHLVYAVLSAFGSSGPDAQRPGIDLIFQGESGMMSLAGAEGDPPQKTATTIADFVAGTNAALAVLAAIAGGGGRGGGRGSLVEVSLRDSLIAVQAGWNAQFFAHGSQPRRTGTASPVTGPNQTYRTADGHLNVAVVSDRHFVETCRALGLDELIGDPRFATNATRVANRAELNGKLEAVLGMHPTAHWLARLTEAGVPAGRILDLPSVFTDPQVIHNEMVVTTEHPGAGSIRTQGSPLRIDGHSARAGRPAPLLGQHTRSVLEELGVPSHRIDHWADMGAIVG